MEGQARVHAVIDASDALQLGRMEKRILDS
jgi:hypothetical protein